MRARTPARKIVFDGARGVWKFGRHEVRADDMDGAAVRFRLYTVTARERLVGSYSGKIGSTPNEVAQYLLYFLETGKPWHHGLAKKDLA